MLQALFRPSRRLFLEAARRGTVNHTQPSFNPISTPSLRRYASKKSSKAAQSTSDLVPGSKQKLSGDPLKEYENADGKMKSSVDWFNKEAKSAESRASGRITPDLLHPVRVTLPARPDPVKLEEIATVGIRDGTTILVTVFEEDSLKHVEKALHTAKIPHVVPQRVDSRTIRIPMPKPTVESRKESLVAVQKLAEETRMQIRKTHQACLKKGKFAKHSLEIDEFQNLSDTHIAEVDKILGDLKKALGSSK